jgi:hypothetical protein
VEQLANVVACSDHHQGGLADLSVALPRGMTPRTAAFTAAPPQLASINALVRFFLHLLLKCTKKGAISAISIENR